MKNSSVIVPLLSGVAGLSIGWLIWAGGKVDYPQTTEQGTVDNRRKPQAQSSSVPNRKVGLAENFAQETFGEKASSQDNASLEARKCFEALDEGDPERRFAKFLIGLDGISAADVPVIFAKIKADDKLGRGVVKEWESFIQKWGELDQKSALDFAAAHETPGARSWGYGMVLRGWARKDAVAAVTWLNSQTDMSSWDEVCGNLLKGVNEQNPWLASATVGQTELKVDWVRDQVVAMIGESMVRRGGAAEVRKWYDSLPMTSAYQHKLKATAMKEAVKYIGKADLAGAAEWLLQQPKEPWRPEEPFATVAKQLAEKAPQQALEWLAKVSAGSNTLAVGTGRELLAAWLQVAPSQARAWVDRQPDKLFVQKISKK